MIFEWSLFCSFSFASAEGFCISVRIFLIDDDSLVGPLLSVDSVSTEFVSTSGRFSAALNPIERVLMSLLWFGVSNLDGCLIDLS